MTLDVSTGFNLHSLLTIYTWFLPTDVTGTIFSKSHADWTSANTSGFLSIELAPAGVVNFVANLDSNISTPISSAYTLDSWNHLGLIVSYDEATVTTSIQPQVNALEQVAVSISNMVLIESPLSWGAIGARYDGSDTGRVISTYYTGFIYSINVYTGTRLMTDISNEVYSANCDGPCSDCPASNGRCQWTCAWDQYEDENGVCQSCNCGAQHISSWSGCVDGDDCSLCADPTCNACDDFTTLECNSCDTSGACVCASGQYHETDTDLCTACNPACDECNESTIYRCSECATGRFLQTDATFCYLFCPTGYDESGKTCTLNTSLALWVMFTEVDIDPIIFAESGVVLESTSESTPMKHRGHYFHGSSFWKVDNDVKTFYFHHSFTIIAWIRLDNDMADDTKQTIVSKANHNASANNQVNLLDFNTAQANGLVSLGIELYSPGAEIASQKSQDGFLNKDSWTMVAIVVDYDSETRVSDVHM